MEKLEYLPLYKFKTSKNLEVCSLKSWLSSFLIRDFGGCRGIWRNQGCRLLEVAGEQEGFHSKVERNVRGISMAFNSPEFHSCHFVTVVQGAASLI